jgi:6-phosphogluconolactonase/glucosamine-6-phosphate isomerase/deaminase
MSVSFVRVDDVAPVVDFLVGRLSMALEGSKKVLWLVPGGSAITIATMVSQRLGGLPLHNLRVSLTDERFGPPGHPDSNWQQLMQSGFALPGAVLEPVLHGQTIMDDCLAFDQWLAGQLADCDYSLGFFGMGSDGHTAGILPQSSAADAPSIAAQYDGGAFQRITMTGKAIAQLDEAVLYAVGQEKAAALAMLDQTVAPREQPAQYLKLVNKLTVFNDHKGDTQ